MKRDDNRVKIFIERSLIVPLTNFLKQGLSPKKLALCVACGVSLGIFPVIGTTTLLCLLAALVFRLNIPAIQLINYFVSPLQFLLFIPFIRLGEFIFLQKQFPLDIFQILTLLNTNFFQGIHALWWITIHSIVAWITVGPLLGVFLYFIFVKIFTRFAKKI